MVHLRLLLLAAGRRAAVLSVAKLTSGQEAYYEQQVANGLDDYYAGRGESPGQWTGSGAEGLGLSGVVGDGDLGTVLRGVDPVSGTELRAPVRGRTIMARTLDVESGEWREVPKRLAPVSGFDLVFSCPKSVSVLHALTDDERVRREISEAHESAWKGALSYLEGEACVVRRGHGGEVRERGEGFVAAAFRHRTSRAQDPHLHTHVIVANMARCADGEWRALDGDAVLRTYRLAAGYLYEAGLRDELTRRLGVSWTEPTKGMGELERFPEQAIRAFSTRRQALVEHMQARGTEGFAAARVAALATRAAKEQVDLPRLRQEWLARAQEHGLGLRELRAFGRENRRERTLVDREELANRLLAPGGLTEKNPTFTMPQLVCAIAGSTRNGAGAEQVLEAAEELSWFPGIERLAAATAPGRPDRFTTRELLEIESQALELALAGRHAGVPCPDEEILTRTLIQSGLELTGEQRTLIREASCRPDRVVCVVGAAGAGKTTALRVLADVYRESGAPVLGAAPSGRAADELANAAGIRSTTLHRLLLDARREDGLPRGCVLVVDEAGMGETRVLAPLLELVDRVGGKAILVGDPAQLPSVGAGGLYQAFCDRLGAITLTENRRQHDLSERQALARLRAGDPEPYLARAARRGRLQLTDDPALAKRQLLEDWWQAAEHDPRGAVMLAYRREDVRDLNQAARKLMLAAGRLGDDKRDLGEREFRVGDRVICRRNDANLLVRNGTRATVIGYDPATLRLRTDTGALRSISASYAAEHLEHGYALTGHAAQGTTVERSFVLLPGRGALQEWGYVALSRARTETRLYLSDAECERETHGREGNGLDLSDRVSRALTTPASEPLAIDRAQPRLDSTSRLLAQQHEHLEELRLQSGQRLVAAERALQKLGWRGRGRRACKLQTEIAFQQTAIRLADQKRAGLTPPTTAEPTRPRRDRHQQHVRTHSLESHLDRCPPGLDLDI